MMKLYGIVFDTNVLLYSTWVLHFFQHGLTSPMGLVEVTEGDKMLQMEDAFLNMLEPMAMKQEDHRAKRRKDNHPPRGSGSQTSSTRDSSPTVNSLCRTMAALLLRHEDSLNAAASQDSFVMYLTSGPRGALEWKEQEAPTQALRLHLAQALMDLLITRFETFCKQLTTDSNFMQQSLETGVVLKDGSFPFLKWNPKLKKTEISSEPSTPVQEMKARLQRIQQAFLESANLIRFHSLKSTKGDENSPNTVIPWKLQLSARNDALMIEVRSLVNSSIWLLIAGRLRIHSFQRSGLAQDLQRQAFHASRRR